MPIGSSQNLPPTSSGNFQTVPSFANLPDPVLSGVGAAYVTADTGVLYISDGAAWNATAGGGSVVGGTNVGGGSGVFKDLSAGNLRFKSFTSTGGTVAITTTANTVNLDLGVISIAHGGTGQSNAQAALNNLTSIGLHNNGDFMILSGGNAQFAAITSDNVPEGATNLYLTYAGITSALGLPVNSFVFSDAASNVVGYSSWAIDPTTHFSSVDNTFAPNDLAAFTSGHYWGFNIAPLQNSPDDSMYFHNYNVNLDSASSGFTFGTNNQTGSILGGGYNYAGNSATYGRIRNINFFASLGNGTDPGTINGVSASSHAYSFASGMTIDGGCDGFALNISADPATVTTSNFNIILLSDFSQLPVDVYGYQGVIVQPNIATIKNGTNFNSFACYANVATMAGNSSFTPFTASGTITTLGTGGYTAYQSNTNITTVGAGRSVIILSCFNQISDIAATSNFQGSVISPTITNLDGEFTGYISSPTITGGTGGVVLWSGGLSNVSTTAPTYVANMSGLTADGNQSRFAIDGVQTNISGAMKPLSGQGTQIQHLLFTSFEPTGLGAIVGTDCLMNTFSPSVDFGNIGDSIALGPFGLGTAMVAFAGQLGGHGSMDLLSAVVPTGIFQSDFTLGEWRNVNAYVINAGYSGACAKATAFYHEIGGAGLFATDHWGLKVVTPGVQNAVDSLAVGASTFKVANSSVAIDLAATDRALLLNRLDNAEEAALTAIDGMIMYNNQTNKFRGRENGVWVNLI